MTPAPGMEPQINSPTRFRVKVREAWREREYVIEANTRDAAWQRVAHDRADMEPDRVRDYAEQVYWAATDGN